METFNPKCSCKVKYFGVVTFAAHSSAVISSNQHKAGTAGTPRLGCQGLEQSCSDRSPTRAAEGPSQLWGSGRRCRAWNGSTAALTEEQCLGLYGVCRCCRTSLAIPKVAVMDSPQRSIVAIFFSFISLRTGVVYFLFMREWATIFLCSNALQL